MDVRGVDLNLLVVFEAMHARRSVTRAGEAVGLSQPAMSAALNRLRRLFDDPLFVKVGAEMQPTPRALSLIEPVRRVMETVRGEILQQPAFAAQRTERIFTLLTPDIGEVNFLPRLLQGFAREAPQARLRTLTRPRHAAAQALTDGEADLAVGYFPDLRKSGFFQQKLFESAHVCLLRADHPAAGERLTLKQYLALPHVVVRPEGREHVFEQFLARRGIRLHVLLELSHFMSLLPVLEGSDLVATVPSDLAEVCCRYGTLRMLPAPVKPPTTAVHQFWHRRLHHDPGQVWLRGLVRSLFAAQD